MHDGALMRAAVGIVFAAYATILYNQGQRALTLQGELRERIAALEVQVRLSDDCPPDHLPPE